MASLSRLWHLPYRVVRKLATANICCFFGCDSGKIRFTPLPTGFRFEELTAERLCYLATRPNNPFDDSQKQLLEEKLAYGFAVIEQHSVAAFCWVATGDVPAEFNQGGSEMTQLPIFLPSRAAYIFNVFVVPQYRGRRLYGAMMSRLADSMQSRGISQLIITTEGSNVQALRSVHRMGFEELGRSMLFRVGNYCLIRYPPQPLTGDVRLGRYVGDCTPRGPES